MTEGVTVVGERVADRYVLRQVLGRGGQAAVWRAFDLEQQSDVALKLLHASRRDSQHARTRLGREASILQSLTHPHVARCIDFDLDVDRPYIAMELVEGVNLAHEMGQRTKRGLQFGLSEVKLLFGQLLSAVGYAHERGVVHRDLKPLNIMFVRSGEEITTKLLDLGVAKLMHRVASDQTTQGRVMGSFLYMSPEQAVGASIDPRADLFALGTLLFEVLTLRRAWARDEKGAHPPAFLSALVPTKHNAPTEILQRMLSPKRPRPSSIRTELGPAVDEVVSRALAVRPDDRFENAAEFREALDAALEVETSGTRLIVVGWGGDANVEDALEPVAVEDAELERARLLFPKGDGPPASRTITSSGAAPSEGSAEPPTSVLRPGAEDSSATLIDPLRRPRPRGITQARALGLGLGVAVIAAGAFTLRARSPVPPVAARVPVAPVPVAARVPVAPVPGAVRGTLSDVSAPEAKLESSPEPARPATEAASRKPPPREVPRQSASPTPTSSPSAAITAKAAALGEVRALLVQLRQNPPNLALSQRAARTLIEAADREVADGPRRTRIKRLANAGLISGDVEQLERAFAELEKS